MPGLRLSSIEHAVSPWWRCNFRSNSTKRSHGKLTRYESFQQRIRCAARHLRVFARRPIGAIRQFKCRSISHLLAVYSRAKRRSGVPIHGMIRAPQTRAARPWRRVESTNRSRSFGALIALGFTISFVMLIVIGAVGYFSIAKVWNNTHELGATYAVIDQLSELISALKDAETGQRGYLLTGDDTYLEPYRLADASIDDALKQLRDSTADDPVQARRLEQAVPLIQSKMAKLKQTIELRRSQGLDAALKVVTTGQGKAYMDKIRQVVAEMDNHN